MKTHYYDLRPQEFLDRLNACPIGYLPLGTIEWHGFHMPLGADSIQSEGVFTLLAEKVGGIVFPPIFLGPDLKDDDGHYGMDICSFEDGKAQQLAGSCYYAEEELYAAMLHQIIRNAKRAGFRLIVAHGHGPSINYVRAHKDDFELPIYTLFDIALSDEMGIMNDHAAANETSITMCLYPELVDMKAIEAYGFPLASWGKDPRTEASTEFGWHLIQENLEKATETLTKLVKNLGPLEKREMHYSDHKNLLS